MTAPAVALVVPIDFAPADFVAVSAAAIAGSFAAVVIGFVGSAGSVGFAAIAIVAVV